MANKLVLIIDDDEDLCELLVSMLEGGGYRAAAASDGVRAMMLVRQDKPALIILDYMFPAGGGGALHKRLRAVPDTRRTPIIMLSGLAESIIAKNVDMDGSTYFLGKPCKRAVLLALIDQILS